MAKLELDYMEYASDASVQANYVSSDTTISTIDFYSEANQDSDSRIQGDDENRFTETGQAITLTTQTIITSVKFYLKRVTAPTGNLYAMIYAATGTVGTNAIPTGSALATSDAVDSSGIGVVYALVTFTFSTPYLASAGDYCIVINGDNVLNQPIYVGRDSSTPTHEGNGNYKFQGSWYSWSTVDTCFYLYGNPNLQCYSEDTIKTQGAYSLKAIAFQTDSLNDTLTKSGLSIDLTDKDEIKVDVYASRTGTNIQLQLKQLGYTADLCIGGSAISGGDDAERVKERAFDDDTGTFWASAQRNGGVSGVAYIGYDRGAGNDIAVARFTIQQYIGDNNIDSVILQYSDNGSAWTSLQTFSLVKDGSFQTKDVTETTSSHRYWRLLANANPSESQIVWAVKEIEMMEADYTTHTKDIAISSAGVWETKTWDISGIADGDKDDIDQIIIKIINADADNTFYVDNFFARDVAVDNSIFFGSNF